MVWAGIEGTDGTGKTTMANAVRDELAARFGSATLIHRGPPEKSVLEEYATDVEGRENEHLVFDRWHLGSCVYAPLYRGTGPYGELGSGGFRWVEKFLQARGAKFYVVDLPYPTVKRRLETRGEDYLQSHHVEGVLERFRIVNDMSVLTESLFTPPTELDCVPAAAKVIVDDALQYAAGAAELRAFPSYVGGPYPSVLLVGEKRGGKPPFESQACFMPLKNKSGEYLWECLPEGFWQGVGVANACEGDDIAKLWETLDSPPVVALGKEASKRLYDLDIDHAGVPHPQRVKRFHNRLQEEYGALIEEVSVTGEQRFSWPS
jgi:hypothetical protein